MESVHRIKKGDIKLEYFETGEGNKFLIDDTVGRNYGLPFTFGVAEVYPSKGIEFDYDNDGAVCICLEGTITLTDQQTGEKDLFEEGDIIYIPQVEGKLIVWSAVAYSKFAFVTYPHWR
jgi:ethanolamine utilization protein EutQ (cupin superfamily)